MKSSAALVAAAVVLALAPLAASARDDGVYSGAVVESIDAGTMAVTLNGIGTYRFAPAGLATQMKRGSALDIYWQDINGDRVITHVKRAF